MVETNKIRKRAKSSPATLPELFQNRTSFGPDVVFLTIVSRLVNQIDVGEMIDRSLLDRLLRRAQTIYN